MTANVRGVNWPLGLLGALGGGSLGYFAFGYLIEQGFYAIVLPGALAGLGAGALSGGKSKPLGVVCGLLAIVLGIVTEWRFAPFVADESFSFFVRHLHKLKPLTQILIGVGAVLGFWFGIGRAGGVWRRRSATSG